jgi:hypothetical protein
LVRASKIRAAPDAGPLRGEIQSIKQDFNRTKHDHRREHRELGMIRSLIYTYMVI